MFDLFNEHFYECELNPPGHYCIAGRRAWGLWLVQYQRDMELHRRTVYREINLCAEYLNRPNLIGAGNRFQFIDNHYHGTGLLPREYRKMIK